MTSSTTSLKTALLVAVLAPAALVFTGCSTNQVRNVDSKGPQALNTSGINSQDWANAADQLVGVLQILNTSGYCKALKLSATNRLRLLGWVNDV